MDLFLLRQYIFVNIQTFIWVLENYWFSLIHLSTWDFNIIKAIDYFKYKKKRNYSVGPAQKFFKEKKKIKINNFLNLNLYWEGLGWVFKKLCFHVCSLSMVFEVLWQK